MEQERKDFIKTKIAEIERLIKEFEAKFESGTSDIENFIKIGEIIIKALINKGNEKELAKLSDQVLKLTNKYPLKGKYYE